MRINKKKIENALVIAVGCIFLAILAYAALSLVRN